MRREPLRVSVILRYLGFDVRAGGEDTMQIEGVVDRVRRYKNEERRRAEAMCFSIGCLIVIAIVYFVYFQYFLAAMVVTNVTYYIAWGTVILMGSGCVYGLVTHLYYQCCGIKLVITPQEKTLFNLQESRHVLVLSEQQQQQQQQLSCTRSSSTPRLQLQLSPTPSPGSYYPPPHYNSLPYSPTDSPYSQHWSPSSVRNGSGAGWLNGSNLSPSFNTTQSLSLSGGSGIFGSGSPLNLSVSGGYNTYGGSDMTPTSKGDLRRRHASVSPHSSSKRGDSFLCSAEELSDYLDRDRSKREADERFYAALDARRLDRSSPTQAAVSRWSTGLTMLRDWLPELSRFTYQPACLSASPHTATPADKHTASTNVSTQFNNLSATASLHAWSRMGVSQDEVDRWRQNLRKWLSETILCRVVREIENINKTLISVGSDDLQIGRVSVSTLRTVAQSKSQLLPSLDQLIAFLDVTVHQEYLVQRVIELASTGCMSSFRWNAGGEFKGKQWQENLPTDSEILIHMLCTYLDSRLPVHPCCIDGRTFTSQHFIRAPNTPCPGDKSDSLLCIYQQSQAPPHFNVIIADHMCSIEQGRNNLFDAVLLFLYHVKTKEKGMLRRVNLGMSGVNVLWIFDY